ncbi:hypothetical protein IF1G_09714 [Cordyceps javanica]|uniref:Uncharacterized protein n=1 Tax=Cordyceps javanica TaxID=43265 RepID=A0A545UQB3_9HYPO|nr:hypothetical protein IF1G_09714 [Cordyceps javanica]
MFSGAVLRKVLIAGYNMQGSVCNPHSVSTYRYAPARCYIASADGPNDGQWTLIPTRHEPLMRAGRLRVLASRRNPRGN